MSEFPPAQFQDPDPERAAAFEEWSQFQPPAVFVNYRTACHRAFIAGYNMHRPHIEALERTGQELLDILGAEMGDVPASLRVAEKLLAFKAALVREEPRKPLSDMPLSEMTPEKLSPLCKDLFNFMSRLDYEGLHWDEREALEVLGPVTELEARIEALEKYTERPLHKESWLIIGSTNQFASLKQDIAMVCQDVIDACCIDELCINDILQMFLRHGYIVTALAAEEKRP